MVTIKFIAQKAGVSTATVSRVLNHTKYVSPEVEKRVLQVVEKYNYSPSAVAIALSTNHTRTFGLLVADKVNMFQSQLLQYISYYSGICGYSNINALCKEDFESKLKAIEMLQTKKVDVVVCTFDLTEQEKQKIRDRINIPIVGAGIAEKANGTFEGDKDAVFKAVEYLIKLGHTKIGGVFPKNENRKGFIEGRQAGFMGALETYNIPVMKKYICDDVANMADAVQKIRFIAKKDDYPTAIFCYSDEVAIGTMLYLAQISLRVPDDISIIGFDGIPVGNVITPRLTTIVQPIDLMAKVLVEQMICVAEQKPFTISDATLDKLKSHLEIRESCRSI